MTENNETGSAARTPKGLAETREELQEALENAQNRDTVVFNEAASSGSDRREFAKAREETRKFAAIGAVASRTSHRETGNASVTLPDNSIQELGEVASPYQERQKQLDRIEDKLDKLLEALDDDE